MFQETDEDLQNKLQTLFKDHQPAEGALDNFDDLEN